MSTTTRAPRHAANRKTWAIMLAGLYAEMFRRFPTPTNLTKWADLEEEISNV